MRPGNLTVPAPVTLIPAKPSTGGTEPPISRLGTLAIPDR